MAAIIATMRTYNEWLADGRVTRKGEHADHYRVSDDGQKGIALFREDQTIQIGAEPEPSAEWTRVVTTEEWRRLKKKPTGKPKLKVRPHLDGVAIWVGSSKDLIANLQERQYRFDRGLNRWIKRPANFEAIVQTLREWGKAEIEVEGPQI